MELKKDKTFPWFVKKLLSWQYMILFRGPLYLGDN